MKLKDREHGINRGIFFIGNQHLNKTQVENGDMVVLHLDGDNDALHVIVTNIMENGQYRGRVELFESSPYDTLEGVSLGDVIEFEDKHIFACHDR